MSSLQSTPLGATALDKGAVQYHHCPVMLAESIEGLAVKPAGTYVDLTFGGGGHARAILAQLGCQGRLLAFDQDPEGAAEAAKIEDRRFTFIQANFRFVTQFLAFHNVTQVDGVLADLGVSSHQLDRAGRGFANRLRGPLDMRMNPALPKSAATLLESYTERELVAVLERYGEIRYARRLAERIVDARKVKLLTTTTELKEIAAGCAPRRHPHKYYAKVFQAFRIAVNDEIGALEEMLLQTPRLVKRGGRLVVLSYHGLEDRLVKSFIKTGNLTGKLTQDVYGHVVRPFEPLHRKVVKATETEVVENNRARSARLRVGCRVVGLMKGAL